MKAGTSTILLLCLAASVFDVDAYIRGSKDDERALKSKAKGEKSRNHWETEAPTEHAGKGKKYDKKKKSWKYSDWETEAPTEYATEDWYDYKKKKDKKKDKKYKKEKKLKKYYDTYAPTEYRWWETEAPTKWKYWETEAPTEYETMWPKGKGKKGKSKKYKKGKAKKGKKSKYYKGDSSYSSDSSPDVVERPRAGENVCAGRDPNVPNVACVIDGVLQAREQAGGNVTLGYVGGYETTSEPTTDPFWMNGMCAVNVHWTLGTEHYSAGEYDENGTGPSSDPMSGDVRQGFRCSLYNSDDSRFTTEYDWQYCVGMEVGQTYEVHWPHSAAGACGTPNQFQTPFYDGMFCRDGVLTDTAGQIGVQAQVFTVVNDEDYYYPDLMRGWIVDGDYGSDIAYYTGSTTGTSRNNEVCSRYSPITWQVDRQCHLVSASSFDKMCMDMLSQRDDMSDDVSPHGSRELVAGFLNANNLQRD